MTHSEANAAPVMVDSHCHLDFPDFEGELSDVIARATDAGVTRCVTICTRLGNEPRIRAIAETYPGVWYAAGVHPMNVAEEPPVTVHDLLRIAEHPKMVGIGETGLDYHYSRDSASAQQESLRVHIEAARQTGLPLIIHARDADKDMAEILTQEWHAGAFTCVMHCFSSGPNLARAALDLGFYLSLSGIAAFPRSNALRDIFAAAPIDRILTETDSPYLAPPPFRGRRNEPAYLVHTANECCRLWGLTPVEFGRVTSANFDRLFKRAATRRAVA